MVWIMVLLVWSGHSCPLNRAANSNFGDSGKASQD